MEILKLNENAFEQQQKLEYKRREAVIENRVLPLSDLMHWLIGGLFGGVL